MIDPRFSMRSALMSPATDLVTAEQLQAYDAAGLRTELVRGRLLIREPAGYAHGRVAARLLSRLCAFVDRDQADRMAPHPLGDVLAAETGFTLQRNPDTVRAPDVAFVAWHRRPMAATGFAEMAPDLAVEVLSPGDRPSDVLTKVADWLGAGAVLVWIVDPARRQVRVYRADGSESIVEDGGSVSGESTLPGFVLMLARLFD